MNNIHVNGSHQLKVKLLPDCLSGEKIGGMGMSEPGSGTDVLGMKTKATREGESFCLNGQKMWITVSFVTRTARAVTASWGLKAISLVERNLGRANNG